MRNNEVDDAPATEPREGPDPGRDPASDATPLPAPATPLLILASDGDAVCVDDLCLPADARS